MAALFAVGLPFTYNGTTSHFATTTGGGATVAAVTSADTVTIDSLSGTGTLTVGAAWSCSTLTINNASSGLACDGTHGVTASGAVTLTAGTLNTNGQTCSWGSLSSTNSNTRAITLGASAITITAASNAAWNTGTSSGLTLSASSSTITFTSATTAGMAASAGGTNTTTFGTLIFNGFTTTCWLQSPTLICSTLTITPGASKTGILEISTGGSGITVSSALTITGNSVTNRLMFYTIAGTGQISPGTPITVTTNGTFSLANINFADITAAGSAGAWAGTSLGNAGGNTNITTDAPAAQTWNGNTTGSWSTAANWTSRVPLPQDDVTISGLTSGTITMDMPYSCRNFSLVGSSGGTITFSQAPTVYGNVTLVAAVTVANASWGLLGRGSQTFTSAGKTPATITLNAVSGSYALQDTLTVNTSITHQSGGFTTNSFNVTVPLYTTNTLATTTKTVTPGSSTITLSSATGPLGTYSVGTTWTANTATIVLSDTGAADKSINCNSQDFGGATLQITGGGAGKILIGNVNDGTVTWGALIIGAPKTVQFYPGKTYNFGRIIAVGSAGNVITIGSQTPASATTVKQTGPLGQVSMDYVTVGDITTTGGGAWYVGSHGTVSTGNTGVNAGYSTTTCTIASAGGNANATGSYVEGVVPTASLDLVAYPGSGNLTVNVSSNCRNLDLLGYAGTLLYSAQLVANPTAAGVIRFASGMTLTPGGQTQAVSVASGTNCTFTTAGKTVPAMNFTGSTTGGTTCSDAFTTAQTVTLTQGTLNTNGQVCSWGAFSSNNSNTRTLTITNSAIGLTLAATTVWGANLSTNLTLNATGSTITCATASPTWRGGTTAITYGSVVFTGSGATTMGDSSTNVIYTNFRRTGTVAKTDSLVIGGTLIVTGTLTLGGSTTQGVNRLLVSTSTIGTTHGFSCTGAAVVVNGDVDFMDISITGSPTWANAGSAFVGDALGNSTLIVTNRTTPAAQASTGTASFSWSTHGWTSRVPLPQDNVTVANAFVAGRTVTMDMPRLGANLDFSGATGSPNVAFSTFSVASYGNLAWAAGVQPGGGSSFWGLNGRGAQTFTNNGMSIAPANAVRWSVDAGGTYTMQDAITMGANGSPSLLRVQLGTLDLGSFTHTIGSLIAATTGVTLNCNSSNILLNSTSVGNIVNVTSGATVNASSASFTVASTAVAQTWTGGSKTYGLVTFLGGAGALTVAGANTFTTLSLAADARLILPSSTITVVGQLVSGGTSGHLAVLTASTPGTPATLSSSSTVLTDYLSVTDVTAAGKVPFYAGPHSTLSNAANWVARWSLSDRFSTSAAIGRPTSAANVARPPQSASAGRPASLANLGKPQTSSATTRPQTGVNLNA